MWTYILLGGLGIYAFKEAVDGVDDIFSTISSFLKDNMFLLGLVVVIIFFMYSQKQRSKEKLMAYNLEMAKLKLV